MIMEQILGLDLGTNSIGWAITEKDETGFRLIDRGVDIFQEGVNRTKSGEEPTVKERTKARALRRLYFRRRQRKIELLKVLIENDMCPWLSMEQLDNWRYKKQYPLDEDFIQWQRTDDNISKNPYYDRYIAVTETLDMSEKKNRYIIGRALYHMAQRRGFLSIRKDSSSGDEDGKVSGGINKLDDDMLSANCQYVGEFFYKLYSIGEKIRTPDAYGYTSRKTHYEKEFNAICDKQGIDDAVRKALYRAIFFQRPLKSQRGLVGRCTFEKNKARCPISHPRYEEYRMLCFLNNVKKKTLLDESLRPLTAEERREAEELFYRKSKEHFDFEDIAKKLAGKRNTYGYVGDRESKDCVFNFKMITPVTGSPVISSLKDIFGDDYITEICSLYTKSQGKTPEQVLNDIWHALFSFTDDDMLSEWGKEKLQLTDEQAKKFIKIPIKQGYASLSLNAINKILPYLRAGYRYDEAVFLANLKAVLPSEIVNNDDRYANVVEAVCLALEDYEQNPINKERKRTKQECIENLLLDEYDVDYNRLSRLYHPSITEVYKNAEPNKYGVLQLGSPRTSSVRNPMAMRALFRLRALINYLLREGKIDRHTKINIEFSRSLNDANMRAAIEREQRERESKHKEYVDEIKKLVKEDCHIDIEPTEDDILKYQLWIEQNKKCLYTGEEIKISDFIGSTPVYDIEHTVPRSRGGDNSQMNKTLCKWDFNRHIKREKIPYELSNYDEVMAHIEQLGWMEKIEQEEKSIAISRRNSRRATTKDAKDKAIQERHYHTIRLNYWKGKLERFTMKEVPEGFSARQGVDIGIIGKYARMYLKTLFDRIYTVKGATTADFRKMWGLQDEYTKKERVNHVHHCIDAVTIACIDKGAYDSWAQYTRDVERYIWKHGDRPVVEKPWPTFTEDVKSIASELIVSHYTANKMPKNTSKLLRSRGKIKRNASGEKIFLQGDTARGPLHKEKFYGAIMIGDKKVYVIRKGISELKDTEIKYIVDDEVRQKVIEAKDKYGFNNLSNLKKYPIWMNEEKGIQIKKVRIRLDHQGGVEDPLKLKKHRDISHCEYKRYIYVANDSNYCMAIYEGEDNRGKTKRSFKVVNNMEAAAYYNDKTGRDSLVPLSDENDYPIKCILRIGTMVLFYENTPDELYSCSPKELTKRLYRVIKLNKDGRVAYKFHQEARNDDKLKSDYEKVYGEKAPKSLTNGYSSINFEKPLPKLLLSPGNFNMLVEGEDFEITVAGEIKFKNM